MIKYISKLVNFFKPLPKVFDTSISERRTKEKLNDKENKVLAAKLKRQEKSIKKQNQIKNAKANNYTSK